MEPQVLTGTISRNDAEGVFVEIPFLGPGSEFGPCEVVADQTLMTRGTRVAVASVEGIVEDYLILGSLESDAASGVVMWWSGIGAPDNLLGSNDDMYLRDDGGVYKKVTGAWVFQFSIKGVQGDPGPSVTGPPGDTINTGDKNFVPNSGFELINAIHGTTNVFSGWSSFWSGTGAVVVQETVLANVHTGLSCARLDIPANNFARVGMTDPFAVAANEVVTLTMWAKTDSPSATASLALFTNASPVSPDFFTTPGSSILGEQFDLTNVWTQYKCTVIVPAGHDLGKFYLTGQNNAATPQKIWFDDVACYREAASGGQALKIRTFTRRLQRPMGGGGVRTCEVVSVSVRSGGRSRSSWRTSPATTTPCHLRGTSIYCLHSTASTSPVTVALRTRQLPEHVSPWSVARRCTTNMLLVRAWSTDSAIASLGTARTSRYRRTGYRLSRMTLPSELKRSTGLTVEVNQVGTM
jgi:hypothetical protein